MQADTSSAFLYESLATSITTLIDAGTLQPGDRLPSVRKLSQRRGVSISTVLQAYRLLEDRRLVEARPQSGYYVRSYVRQRPIEPRQSNPPPKPQAVSVGDLVIEVLGMTHAAHLAQLSAAVPSPDLLPTKRLNRMLARIARTGGDRINGYVPLGDPELRQEIARRSLDGGFTLSPEDVLITNGCMEALMLAVRAVAQAGDTIAVESPAYFGVLQLLESLELKVLEVSTHPRYGVCLDAFEQALRAGNVKACLLTPNFQNPLGSLMTDDRKQFVMDVATRYQVPIIEDDLYGDLYFAPPRPTSLKAFDREGLVIQCSSFSKTLAPGYRVGWIAPGRYMRAIKRIKFGTSIASSMPPQVAISTFLRDGGYDRHLRAMRSALSCQIDQMTAAICEHFPLGTRVTRPQGGFVLWVELPPTADTMVLYRAAQAHGVSFVPGPLFSTTNQYNHFMRINCGFPWSEALGDQVARLGRLVQEHLV